MTTLIDALKGLHSDMGNHISQTHDDVATPCWFSRLSDIIAEHERSGDWEPIETAPKDRVVILYEEGNGSYEGWWSDEPNYWDERGWYPSDCHNEFSTHPYKPTHWQPLPKGPA